MDQYGYGGNKDEEAGIPAETLPVEITEEQYVIGLVGSDREYPESWDEVYEGEEPT